MYRNGYGVEQNISEAMKWYNLSSEYARTKNERKNETKRKRISKR